MENKEDGTVKGDEGNNIYVKGAKNVSRNGCFINNSSKMKSIFNKILTPSITEMIQ